MLPGTWKGTLVWSGATAMATWLASAPAVVAPGDDRLAPQARFDAADTQAVVVQMQELSSEAERLARRLSGEDAFAAPERDPFRFKAAPAPRASVPAAPPAAAEVAPAPPPVQPPPFALSGIAEDRQGDAIVRTAVVTGGGDLWLVKAGEKVEGKFEVTAVDADAVELIRADTGTAVRLTFRP
ncbi:MAG: hypothetical protein AB7I25_00630 [Vicinamibacterales bacterium]